MKHKAKVLLSAAGAALLATMSLTPLLYAAPATELAVLQSTPPPTTLTTTVESPTPTLTLTLETPPFTSTLETSTPTSTVETLPLTPTLAPPTPTATIESPLPTDTLEPTPSPSNTDTPLTGYHVWAGGSCLLLLLLILLFILAILVMRKAKRGRKPVPPPVPPTASSQPYLESNTTSGPRRFELNPEGITIGRAEENNLVITQDFPGWETVSRRHARIYERGGRWIIEDAGSMNGVYVNGSRTGHNLLREGWRIGVGGVEFIFHTGTGEASR